MAHGEFVTKYGLKYSLAIAGLVSDISAATNGARFVGLLQQLTFSNIRSCPEKG